MARFHQLNEKGELPKDFLFVADQILGSMMLGHRLPAIVRKGISLAIEKLILSKDKANGESWISDEDREMFYGVMCQYLVELVLQSWSHFVRKLLTTIFYKKL